MARREQKKKKKKKQKKKKRPEQRTPIAQTGGLHGFRQRN